MNNEFERLKQEVEAELGKGLKARNQIEAEPQRNFLMLNYKNMKCGKPLAKSPKVFSEIRNHLKYGRPWETSTEVYYESTQGFLGSLFEKNAQDTAG